MQGGAPAALAAASACTMFSFPLARLRKYCWSCKNCIALRRFQEEGSATGAAGTGQGAAAVAAAVGAGRADGAEGGGDADGGAGAPGAAFAEHSALPPVALADVVSG